MLGPTIAGFLLEGGLEMPSAALIMSIGSLIAAGALLFLKLRQEPPEAVEAEKVDAPVTGRMQESSATA